MAQATSVSQNPGNHNIRPFENSEEDREKLWQMWQTIFPSWPIERQRMDKILHKLPGHHFVHERGFCLSYLTEEGSGKIAAIAVLEGHRGNGLGTAFLSSARNALEKAAREAGLEGLKSLDVGSQTPRFWLQMPRIFSQEAKDFFVRRGFRQSSEPKARDLYRDIRNELAPADALAKAAKSNIRFAPWSPEASEECITKQHALFSWGKAYEILAAYGQHHEALVAFDPDTGAQIGWTLMCSPSAIICDMFAFMPLVPSGQKTGLIAAVGVDESARGKGVGLALMVKAMENLKERGIEGIFVDSVVIEGFYERLGFETWCEYEDLKLVKGSEHGNA